jgi:hypothetical protein
MSRARLFLPAVLLVALCGCGGPATVSGKVTYRGRPVLSGSVIFLNQDGTARTGVIQPDGSYSVEGVARGRARIGVLSPDPAHARSILKPPEEPKPDPRANHGKPPPKAGREGWFPLPTALGDPEKSGLECDVSAGRVGHEIEMK